MSHRIRCTLLGLLLPAVITGEATAQNGPAAPRGEIRGKVVSAAGASVSMTTTRVEVTDLARPDSALRTSVSADGNFRAQRLRPGRYRVRFSALGFAPRELPPIVLTAAAPTVDVGTIALTPAPIELQKVTVRDKMDDVQLSPDRNAYVVKDMPSTRGGNALDVLRNVPSVDVDIDNIVSLRGNSGVTVQINGRPSPLKPQQLGNFLSQLPAAMVEKIEIVSNPSARDDPTGVAGIINIVMKQETDAGTNGGITATGSTTGTANLGGNLGYEHEPWALFGSYGFLRDDRPRHESIYRENRYLTPLTYLEETGLRTQKPLANTLTGSAVYAPSKKDELSAEFLYTARHQDERYALDYRDLDNAHALTGLRDRVTSGTGHEGEFEIASAFKHLFAEKGHKVTGEFRVTRGEEGGPNSIVARTLGLHGAPTTTTAREDQTTWEHPTDGFVRVDYARLLNGRVRIEAGYKGSLSKIHTTLDTRVFNTGLNAFAPDSTRISDFTYRQEVHAGYAMASAQLGKFVVQGGLRLETAASEFQLATLHTTFNNSYQSAFPSGLVVYNVDDAYQVKLSYSTRINRPDDTDHLDPTLQYADPLNVSRGNPYLKPEYIRALEFGFQRSTSRTTLQVTPFFRRTFDAVRQIRTIDNVGVATRTFANISTSDSYGADFTLALKGGSLTGFASASAFGTNSNAANIGTGLSIRTFGWRARANVSYRASKTVDAQALLSYQPALTVEQGTNASRTQLNLAARKKLMDDQLSITLRVIDPFNMARESSTTIDPRFYQVSDRKRPIRGLVLAVNWMFGKPQDEKDLGITGTP